MEKIGSGNRFLLGEIQMNPVDFGQCLQADCMTHPGLVRPVNEDAIGFLPESGCFFVADGMGGGSAGEIASSLLENQLTEAIEGSDGESFDQRIRQIRDAIRDANRKIRICAERRSYRQMGTTLAMMLFHPQDERSAAICHIGDSRIYRLRDGLLTALTKDHTVGAELSESGTEGDYAGQMTDHRVSRISHMLTRVIGAEKEPEQEWAETEVRPRDRFLVCSDGVTTMLSEDTIQQILFEAEQPSDAVRLLGDRVLQAGANDNFSLIVVFVNERV